MFSELTADEKLALVREALKSVLGDHPTPRDIEHLSVVTQMVSWELEDSVNHRALLASWFARRGAVSAA